MKRSRAIAAVLCLSIVIAGGAASGDPLPAPLEQNTESSTWLVLADRADGPSWTLTEDNGTTLCVLPCRVALSPSREYLILTADNSQRFRVRVAYGKKGTLKVVPQRGNPTGALALGVASTGLIAFGTFATIFSAVPQECGSACMGPSPVLFIAGLVLGAAGIIGGIYALVWGSRSERTHIEVVDSPAALQPPGETRSLLSWSPRGVSISF